MPGLGQDLKSRPERTSFLESKVPAEHLDSGRSPVTVEGLE